MAQGRTVTTYGHGYIKTNLAGLEYYFCRSRSKNRLNFRLQPEAIAERAEANSQLMRFEIHLIVGSVCCSEVGNSACRLGGCGFLSLA
ncbi:hypothetical protein J6590_046106 [Homalodisca vitripennis]|nr:hypothetical protein J6590_046106 [Homalodisca vitripennis]